MSKEVGIKRREIPIRACKMNHPYYSGDRDFRNLDNYDRKSLRRSKDSAYPREPTYTNNRYNNNVVDQVPYRRSDRTHYFNHKDEYYRDSYRPRYRNRNFIEVRRLKDSYVPNKSMRTNDNHRKRYTTDKNNWKPLENRRHLSEPSPREKKDHYQPSKMKSPLLIVLDLNGTLLCRLKKESPRYKETIHYEYKMHRGDKILHRPHLYPFLNYLAKSPSLFPAVWTSANAKNMGRMIENTVYKDNYLNRSKMALLWDQEKCEVYKRTEIIDPRDRFKPLFIKNLQRIWDNEELKLTWTERNTILIDDSREKMVQMKNTIVIPSFDPDKNENCFQDDSLRTLMDYFDRWKSSDIDDIREYMEKYPIQFSNENVIK